MAGLDDCVQKLIVGEKSKLMGKNFYVRQDDTNHIAIVHFEDCKERQGAGEKCESFDEAVEKGWGEGVRCVRYCTPCWVRAFEGARGICLCPKP